MASRQIRGLEEKITVISHTRVPEVRHPMQAGRQLDKQASRLLGRLVEPTRSDYGRSAQSQSAAAAATALTRKCISRCL
jgi:hypothetical protein